MKQEFTDLKVWERSHQLVLEVYRLTESFPLGERFGLTLMLRQSAITVPKSIAEGTKRRGIVDCARFFDSAEGALGELSYLLLLARDLGYIEPEVCRAYMVETGEITKLLGPLREKYSVGSDLSI